MQTRKRKYMDKARSTQTGKHNKQRWQQITK